MYKDLLRRTWGDEKLNIWNSLHRGGPGQCLTYECETIWLEAILLSTQEDTSVCGFDNGGV